MTERTLCDDAFHDARNREDTTNKARLPCSACGGTWVDYGWANRRAVEAFIAEENDRQQESDRRIASGEVRGFTLCGELPGDADDGR